MIQGKANVLVVDDEPSIRFSMSQVLSEIGYRVRSAADGVAALVEIRREAPEILISDLNMPGMSGFELLPVVRRRFPRVHIVVMSGAFSTSDIPSGVTADAFYPKGGSMLYLIEILESLIPEVRIDPKPSVAVQPIWIASNGHNASGEAYVTIECPECLKSFPEVLTSTVATTSYTACVYCGCSIRYAIARPQDQACVMPLQHERSDGTPARGSKPKLIQRNSAVEK
jgi:CheY-like chemotaxis protein